MLCEIECPITLEELRANVSSFTEKKLITWLSQVADQPSLCEQIEALVRSDILSDTKLVRKLQMAFLVCLCPPEGELQDWPHEKRKALVFAVGSAFDGRVLVPLIAKMEQLWGWKSDWIDPPSRPPVYVNGQDPDLRGMMDPIGG